MQILVLNGSPRPHGNTAAMVEAFRKGAEENSHAVIVVNVCQKKIAGCLACEYCHQEGSGHERQCVQKDDMQAIYPLLDEAEMIVLASPVYYHGFSGQLQCAINRIYALDKPKKLKKAALILSSGSDHVYGGAIYEYQNSFLNYARDISKKIRSTFQAKGKAGRHLTGTVIYGYLWDESRRHWLVDEEAAAVVRRIFAMSMDGYGPYQIARRLSAEKVEIPSIHLARHGEGVNKNKAVKDPYAWGSSVIVSILKKREYLGHTINFKTRKHFKDKKSHYVHESEWSIFENTHEAVIDEETFENVQRIRANVRRYPNGWGEAAPLTGLLYCADCGAKMYVHRINNGKLIPQYTCSNYTKVPCGTRCPTQHRINESVVLALVANTLRAIAAYSQNDRKAFVQTVEDLNAAHCSTDGTQKKKRLAEAKRRADELERLLCKIYEDKLLGRLAESRYAVLDERYANEQEQLIREIETLEATIAAYENRQQSSERFIALLDKYERFDPLTTTMLNEFVEKILVHERARKGSVETTQEVEIYFKFIGKYVPPHFGEMKLTPEEAEALRKREERKDKLHQAYLRRKASGAQKKYEDKVRAKKKAEREAKSAALRADAIARGIFFPVSQLPTSAPRRATVQNRSAI